jgi:hypothetical protein
VVVPVHKLFKSGFLFYHNFAPDSHVVIQKDIFLQALRDLLVILQELEPILLANGVTVEFSKRCVNEGRSLCKCNSITANNTTIYVLDAVFALFVDLVANQNLAFCQENDLSELIKLVDDYFSSGVLRRFQQGKHVGHEVHVGLVLPGVVVLDRLYPPGVHDVVISLFKPKEVLELSLEVTKQKRCVELFLNLVGKLLEESDVFFERDCLVFV